MTISIDSYFDSKPKVRKKEPQYIAFINRNSCTSCESCASMCPVDCIYEVPGTPGQSYHQIDISRCIGCQQCYRVPSESKGPWTMEICPWNAIDLIYNPNFKKEWDSMLEPYFIGNQEEATQTDDAEETNGDEKTEENGSLNFPKLEEIGYQLYLNRSVQTSKELATFEEIQPFAQDIWSWGEGNFSIVYHDAESSNDSFDVFRCTDEGNDLVEFLYRDYEHMFLD